ncbi:MAG: S9 family peptidase [Gammaproteobacteria bacterium]
MKNYNLSKYLLVLIIFGSPLASAENQKPFSAMDVFELEWASNPQVSPDGQTIIYVRESNDIMKDRVHSVLWQINIDGTNHKPLHSGLKSSSSPLWSPDGKKVAYLSSESGSRQIHMLWVDSGTTAVITQLQEAPSSLSWSPDGRWLAFTMNVKSSTEPIAKARSKPEGASWAEKPIVVTSTRYQYDGQGIVEPAYRHVFVVPADGGSARQLTEGNFNHSGALAWSHDSKEIYFSAHRSEDWELISGEADIYSVNVATQTLTQITNQPGAETSPTLSHNGKLLAFNHKVRRPLGYTPEHLAVMDLSKKNIRILTEKLDGDAVEFMWSANDESLYFAYQERGLQKIGNVTLNQKITEITDALGGTSLGRPYLSGNFHISKDIIAYTHGTSTSPAEIAVLDAKGTRVLTQLNEELLGHRLLGRVNEIVYQSSADGQEIQGWYITPPNYDPAKKYPLILEIHGGPYLAYGPHFSAELQLMAAAGYIVFYDNYRGSLSYGEEFAQLLQYKYSSEDDFADHMSGIDALIANNLVDENNLFITGGSAGGIATAYAVGLTDRFKAAVAAKPIINWLSKPLTADSMVHQLYHQFPGPPWEHVEHYWKRSPLSLVGNVTTPTMLMTGEDDRRTPISETEQFYQALKWRGIDTAMVRIPNTSHGIVNRPSNLITKVDYILAWFEKYRTDTQETKTQ